MTEIQWFGLVVGVAAVIVLAADIWRYAKQGGDHRG